MTCFLSPEGSWKKTHLLAFASRTPFEILAQFTLDFAAADTAAAMFDEYDKFLGILSDSTKRDELNKLGADEAMTDSLFEVSREIGRNFHEKLVELFFAKNPDVTRETQRYGVF